MAHVLLYMSAEKIAACLKSADDLTNGGRGLEYNYLTKQVTANLFDIPHGGRLVLDVVLERFNAMVDNMPRLEYYLSLVNDPERIFRLRDKKVRIRLPLGTPSGTIVAVLRPPDGRRVMVDRTQEIAYEQVEDVQFLTERDLHNHAVREAPAEIPTWMAALAPDANFYADGTPKDRIRYPPTISTRIPTSTLWQAAAADAYIATVPEPMSSNNVLVAMDPPDSAAFLMTMQADAVDEAVGALVTTAEKFFEPYAAAERLNTAITFRWWKKAMKVMRAGYKALGETVTLCHATGSIEYEKVRDAVYILRNLIADRLSYGKL